MTTPEQDAQIRDALANRVTPEHREGFFADLRITMETAVKPESETQSESESESEKSKKPTRSHRLRYAWIAPVAAAAVVAVLLATGVTNSDSNSGAGKPDLASPTTGTPTTEIHPLLAAEVIERASAKVGTVTSLSGKVKYETFASEETTSSEASVSTTAFRISSNGDMWSRQDSGFSGSEIVESSFSAATGEERMYAHGSKWGPNASIISNAQDMDRSANAGRLQVLTSSLRALANANDPSLKEVTFDGRPAWQLEGNTTIDTLGVGPDHYIVTVDQETSFPVQVIGDRKGKPFEASTVTELRINPPLTPADFQVSIPADVKVSRIDQGHRRVQLAEVRSVVGYEPFVPTRLPDGFTLSSVTANKNAGPGGPEGSNENNRNLVIMTYRHGLETIQVTTRASANGGQKWNDPLSYEGEPGHAIEKVKLAGGAFNDLTADVVTKSTSDPHLWLVGARWLLTVSGDVGRDELVKVAESVQSPSATDKSINPSTTIK